MAKFAVVIDPLCSRFEKLARLGLMTPQILSADDVRELAQLALDHINAAEGRGADLAACPSGGAD